MLGDVGILRWGHLKSLATHLQCTRIQRSRVLEESSGKVLVDTFLQTLHVTVEARMYVKLFLDRRLFRMYINTEVTIALNQAALNDY